ncbi:hypothetical protein [Flavihumibacter profundi]|jgi:hypothetical protein|uniref:hypothetical protein n=1 Tax=Flavihumibacter profundi TaxID=2716883 RepID=UPI001CC421CF|nr:hypothetical protein [Flavihumibacter profundi]MBZ5858200.1 hypothetical protein [Flavihumibacter profundi]
MQVIKRLLYILSLLVPVVGFSQSTLLPQGYKHQPLMDRLEIRFRDSAMSFQNLKPFDRKSWVGVLERLDTTAVFSKADAHNINSALMNNSEWVTGSKESFQSRKPFLKTLYITKTDLVHVDVKDFFLTVNPVFQFMVGKESGTDEKMFQNTKGATARGLIAHKIGFDFYLTDNQERPPYFVKQFEDTFHAVPGNGFYKAFKETAYDYFDARGSVYFNVTKYINVQFGYDKNFIGDGYRSFFLSDFSSNYLFLKLNTKIWKLDYQNLFMELTPQEPINNGSVLLDKKYAAMHHLSWQANRWLNIGLFESIIYGRENHFEFSYLNPIIFLRSIEQQNGSKDNANVGFDFKTNVAKRFQFYGQVLFDEFKLSEVKGGQGWWGNKWALQLGGKYIDAFGVKNLDLQGEFNMARPFTYSHNDSVSNYSHYNQPLAHPLGANFHEFVGIARYQPHPKWNIQGKLIAWRQGLDSAGINFGSNIFRLYDTRPADYGWSIGTGRKATGVNASLWIGYELAENLFIDASLMVRKYDVPDDPLLTRNITMVSLGFRMNMFRREYDY